MKKQKQFDRFVPILVKESLDSSEYKRKDDLYCIIDLIYRKQINYKTELQKIYGYVEISRKVFKNLIPNDTNLSNGLNFLIESKILLINKHYQPGVFCKSYKIAPDFLSKKVAVTISDKNINKRIDVMQIDSKKFFDKQLEFSQTNYFSTFKIDYKSAYNFIYKEAFTAIKLLSINSNVSLTDEEVINFLECKGNYKYNRARLLNYNSELHNIIHRFMNQHFKILCIDKGYLYFRRNDTNGRLDTNLTNLPTVLRQFLISDETLYNIDIKNSQPFFLFALLYQENAISVEELSKYARLVVEGTFYEYLAAEYEKFTGKPKTRKDAKALLFKIFFSKTTSFVKIKEFFGGLFPEIMEYINENNRVSNSTVANKLSTIESTTIVSVVLPALGEQGIKPFTIHDSFVCKESEIEAIIDTFNDKVISMYGIAPNLHVKTLLEDAVANDDVEDITDEEFWLQMEGLN